MKTIDNKNSKIGFEIDDNRKKLLKVIFEYRSIQFVEADSNLKELKELGEKSVKFF